MNRPLIRLGLGAITLLALAGVAFGQQGFDRRGGDYASGVVRNGDPASCALRCERDQRCRAWTFSYPRTAGREAMCWLKNVVTPAKEAACCVTGVRGAALIEPQTNALEYSIDRYGGDYRSFDMGTEPSAEACAKACQADSRCRAFTYARPGYGNNAARCYLKDRITRPRRKPCCISGVIR